MKAQIIASLMLLASCFAPAQMGMEPPAELKKHAWLIGTWQGEVAWSMPGMEGQKAPMSFTMRWDGQFVRSESVMEMMGMKITETQFVGWDAAAKKFRSWTFSNTSPEPRIEEGEAKGNSLVFVSKPWSVMGQSTVSRATVTKISDTEHTFVLEFQQGNAFQKVGEGRFRKKE